MANTAEKATIRIKMDMNADIRALLAKLNEMDAESKTKLKNEVKGISAWTGSQMKAAAPGSPWMKKQSVAVAKSIRANKDRVPNVTIGGAKKVTSTGATAGVLVFGNEFGASSILESGGRGSRGFASGGHRFPPRTPRSARGGNAGYWIFPTLRGLQPRITTLWHAAVDNILNEWSKR